MLRKSNLCATTVLVGLLSITNFKQTTYRLLSFQNAGRTPPPSPRSDNLCRTRTGEICRKPHIPMAGSWRSCFIGTASVSETSAVAVRVSGRERPRAHPARLPANSRPQSRAGRRLTVRRDGDGDSPTLRAASSVVEHVTFNRMRRVRRERRGATAIRRQGLKPCALSNRCRPKLPRMLS